jgi:uncharacterized phage infection (PIP) family protein YhgE
MSSSKNQRYNSIAKACLKALNSSVSEGKTSEEAASAVYQAIDEAFSVEFESVLSDLKKSTDGLREIRDHCINLMDAQEKAANILNEIQSLPHNSKIH